MDSLSFGRDGAPRFALRRICAAAVWTVLAAAAPAWADQPKQTQQKPQQTQQKPQTAEPGLNALFSGAEGASGAQGAGHSGSGAKSSAPEASGKPDSSLVDLRFALEVEIAQRVELQRDLRRARSAFADLAASKQLNDAGRAEAQRRLAAWDASLSADGKKAVRAESAAFKRHASPVAGYLVKAQSLADKGQSGKALELLKSNRAFDAGVGSDAEQVMSLWLGASSASKLNQCEYALQLIDVFTRRFPDNHYIPEMWSLKAACRHKLRQFDAAKETAKALIDEYPCSPEADEARLLLDEMR